MGFASEEHFETLKVYKQLDRMDRYAAQTGTTPLYMQVGFLSCPLHGKSLVALD